MPTITIPLGISSDGAPSIDRLRKRARARAEMVAANQPELAFLNQTDFPEKMPLLVIENSYVLEGPIPEAQNEPLFDPDWRANIRRGDDAEEARVREVLGALDVSSQLLERVAQLMETSSNVKQDITELERRTGVNTKSVRRFVYDKQAEFDVMVDGEGVTFCAHAVRTIAPRGEPVHVLFTQPCQKLEGRVLQGRVDATLGDNRSIGVQKGGTHDFRLGLLEPWQSALLDCARHFQVPILVTAGEAQTTCGIKDAPAGINNVHNWVELLERALKEFSEAAKNFSAQIQVEKRPE